MGGQNELQHSQDLRDSSMETGYITSHFKYSSLSCKCCNRIKIIPRLYTHMRLLEEVRNIVDFPIIINSGYRCPPHNIAVGGTKKSEHMEFATDVRPEYGENFTHQLSTLNKAAHDIGFNGIIEYPTFTHLDMRSGIYHNTVI